MVVILRSKFYKFILILLSISFLSLKVTTSWAIFVRHLNLVGLNNVNKSSVLDHFVQKEKFDLSYNDLNQVLKNLYSTGFFLDISALYNKNNNNLTLKFKENPIITSVSISGISILKKEEIINVLKQSNLYQGDFFNPVRFKQIEIELRRQYFSLGKYNVKINFIKRYYSRNRVSLELKVTEGSTAVIKDIHIVGNHYFSDNKLRTILLYRKFSIFNLFKRYHSYSEEQLKQNLEKLRILYLNHGFVKFDFTINKNLQKNNKDMEINIILHEGKRYILKRINLASYNHNLQDELIKYVNYSGLNKIYSYQNIENSKQKIINYLSNHGYIFARVDNSYKFNESNSTIDVTLLVDPGKIIYVKDIKILGNYFTHDIVIRRELLQMEGAIVNKHLIDISKRKLYQLGYLDDINVNMESLSSQGYDNQVNLLVNVKERNTGHFTGGIGYSQAEKFSFNVGMTQSNFLGTGNALAVNLSKSSAVTSLGFKYFNPYFTANKIGLGVDVGYNKVNLHKLDITNYVTDTISFGTNLSIPLSLHSNLILGLGYQNIDIRLGASTSLEMREFLRRSRTNNFNIYTAMADWNYSTLDRAIFPTEGFKQIIKLDGSIPGSTTQFYRVRVISRYYQPLYKKDLILYLRGFWGYANKYGKTPIFPLFNNFYGGGIGSVRGFAENSLGPLDSMGHSLGGRQSLNASADLIFPVPFFENNDTLRMSVFADAGNIYSSEIKLNNLRYSSGINLQWLSPFGPIDFSYSWKVINETNERIKHFQFTIGNTF